MEEKKEPKHIELMKRLELVDYCKVSDSGYFKWYPKGCLIKDLILEHAENYFQQKLKSFSTKG